MAKKPEGPSLPVLGGVWASIRDAAGPPTLEQARERLGGAWVGGPGVGELVLVRAATGRRPGVVVHASPTDRDVWIGAGRIQRVPPAELEPTDREDPELEAVAGDARVFASLTEGQAVVYTDRTGTPGEGTLAEKLRYGALVGLGDGRVIAVSFRMLAPADGDAPS